MRIQTVQSRLFLVAESNPADPPGFTDEDLRQAFEQIPFDLDPIADEDGAENA